MAERRLDNHNRFSEEEPDTIPSRLDALTSRHRLEQLNQHRAGWRRNLLIAAIVMIAAALIAKFVAR